MQDVTIDITIQRIIRKYHLIYIFIYCLLLEMREIINSKTDESMILDRLMKLTGTFMTLFTELKDIKTIC